MIETAAKKERAILVGLKTAAVTDQKLSEYMNELELLAATAGADPFMKLLQERSHPDSAYFLGRGKADELARLAEDNSADIIIFDDELSPTQVRNLERLTERKILDRSGLILDIFASRARTREAVIQVELAQLEYLLPRLTRQWTHLSKQFGGIGTKGPGETQIETDRRLIRTRIARLKERLLKIESNRTTGSLRRKDYINATLVGYTNAGKSSLLNIMTSSTVLSEDKLFATLDSTTRTLDIGKSGKILISDTVGFIRKLPAHLVASFKSTLMVVNEADLLLHITDISAPDFEDHIAVVEETLKDLGCLETPRLMIFNKADLCPDQRIEYIRNRFPESLIISALNGINISSLTEEIVKFTKRNYSEYRLSLRQSQGNLLSLIHELTEVISTDYGDEFILVRFYANRATANKIKAMANEQGNT